MQAQHMPLKFPRELQYLGVVPIAIAALAAIDSLWFHIPNQAPPVLLAVVYCAYRGGVTVGLARAAMHVLFTFVFFSDADQLFHYSGENLTRALVLAVVAPAMATLVGLLRRESDRRLAAQQASEATLARANGEPGPRAAIPTAQLFRALAMADQAT